MKSELQKEIGYQFNDENLLERALTHASMQKKNADNERMEFLGDRVLGLAVAAHLYRAYPQEDEGALAKRHTALVQQSALAEVGRRIGLEKYIRQSGTVIGDSVLSDAVEALIGAIYLDGGDVAATSFVSAYWRDLTIALKVPPEDPKTRLQEWVQEAGLPLPVYKILSKSGSDHAPEFDIELTAAGKSMRATAPSKRAAEKKAAAMLLEQLEKNA